MTNLFDELQITAEYSNAVLVAILPHISDFAARLPVPVDLPITTNHVERFLPAKEPGDVGGNLILATGHHFDFAHGHVTAFGSPRSAFPPQHWDRLRELVGAARLSERECVARARDALRGLGYSLESLYADLEPMVIPATTSKPGIPHYLIEWFAPHRHESPSAKMEVDAERGSIERLLFLNQNLDRPPPKVAVEAKVLIGSLSERRRQDVRDETKYKWPEAPGSSGHLVEVAAVVGDLCRKLKLPVEVPITTNHVARFEYDLIHGTPFARLTLTNGYWFNYAWGHVGAFEAPDVFFTWGHEVRVKDFVGPWRMNSLQAADFAREAVRRLGHNPADVFMNRRAKVTRPFIRGGAVVPRYRLEWEGPSGWSEGTSGVVVEIDADKKLIKALHVFDTKRQRAYERSHEEQERQGLPKK